MVWPLAAIVGLGGSLTLPSAELSVPRSEGTARIQAASDEAERAIRGFRVPDGWKVDLIAAEPHLANPVAFTFDEQERIYVVETFRHGDGVLDIRGRAGWPSEGYRRQRGLGREDRGRLAEEVLDADLANRTVEDRERMLRLYFAENAPSLERASDRVRRLVRDASGRVLRSTVFADGFNTIVDGLAAGILARGSDVWFANIPHLWRLRDSDDDGVAEERESLHHGYGVRVGFLGHDLHGLCLGPDGRLYFSIGDRGASVATREGGRLEVPDTGAVFRCEPDGSGLEVFAYGFRNPQELVFDAFGNLWTGDNNSDGGDQARWTHVVEGGDSGWRIGWQFIESPTRRGPWNAEGMWRPEDAAGIAHLVPPLANIGAGPSGVTYGFGTGLPETLNGKFFMVDFRGGPSGIWSIEVRPRGAGYEVAEAKELIWNALPTDVEVGPDGGLYWSDWVEGWNATGRGRIYRAYDPKVVAQPVVQQTRQLLAASVAGQSAEDLGAWLAHPDLRVRQRAQFALAERGAAPVLEAAARQTTNRFARFHGIWGLGRLARLRGMETGALRDLLADADPEVRGQAAAVLGDARDAGAGGALERLLGDPEPRPRFFAALAIGKLGRREAAEAVRNLLRANDDEDPWLRHAGVMALVGTHAPEELGALHDDASAALRRAAVVALRRLESGVVAKFLADGDPVVVLEAARAINDVPIPDAMPALAALLGRVEGPEALMRRVLNANLRAGGPGHAEALAGFAAREDAPEAYRVEALRHLGRFAEPPGRDAVTGLWRPLERRDAQFAREALQRHFEAVLRGSEPIQVEAALAAQRLDVREAMAALSSLARDPGAGSRARVASIRTLASWGGDTVSVLVDDLAGDANAEVRSEALKWRAHFGRGDVVETVREVLDSGSFREQQSALATLGALNLEGAERLLAGWLSRAVESGVAPELQLDLLEAGRASRARRVQAALRKYEQTLAGTNAVDSRRHLLRGGDAEAGRRVFYEKAEAQCVRCHRAGGEGGIVGPDLKGIGSRQSREELLEAIVLPNARIAEGYQNVIIETSDGTEYSGTIRGETEEELVLATLEGEVTVRKADITFRREGLSSMPDGLGEVMSPRELRDLVEFLAGLKES